MKRKGNLSEEVYKMRKLMGYDSKKDFDNVTSYDRLMEEKLVEKYLLSEQGGKGNVGGNIGLGITGKEKDEKASQEDITGLGMDAFAEDVKSAANKTPNSLKISDEIAKKISEGIVVRAQEKGSNMNKIFKKGLLNGTLNINRTTNFSNVKIDVLGNSMAPKDMLIGATVKSEEGVETPDIPVYDSTGKNILYKNPNPENIAYWILSQNVESFKKGEQQYYLTTVSYKGAEGKKVLSPAQKGFFMVVKGDAPGDSIVTVGVSKSESSSGSETPGSTKVNKVPVELEVEMGESFETDISNFSDPNGAINMLLTKIKEELNKKGFNDLEISDISVISSSSNFYGKVVDFTHDKSGNPVKSGINFNQQPTKTNNVNVDKNNLLAWQRGLRILTLLKGVNGTDLGGDLGKVSIVDSPTEKVEWRVTDTDGKPGKETGGQYAKIFIKGQAIKTSFTDIPPNVTSGTNEANLRQALIYVNSDDKGGGIRIASWFELYQGKYDKTGKFKPRSPGTFTGLPKWLDNIVYSNN